MAYPNHNVFLVGYTPCNIYLFTTGLYPSMDNPSAHLLRNPGRYPIMKHSLTFMNFHS